LDEERGARASLEVDHAVTDVGLVGNRMIDFKGEMPSGCGYVTARCPGPTDTTNHQSDEDTEPAQRDVLTGLAHWGKVQGSAPAPSSPAECIIESWRTIPWGHCEFSDTSSRFRPSTVKLIAVISWGGI
jgi:hypothetical protein